jgi:DNA repair protein RadD
MAALELRPYQQEADEALDKFLAEHPVGNPIICAPTGSGKSILLATHIQKRMAATTNRYRCLIVTHVKELIEQNFKELQSLWNWAPAGIYSAGLKRKQAGFPITFCGIQSVHDKAHRFLIPDEILVDECHLIPRNSNTMYRRFINDLKGRNPDLRVIGFTATHYRLDSGLLTEGDDRVFTDVAFEIPVRRLIDEGWLARPVSKKPHTEYDLTGVHTRGGEFVAGELEAAMDQEQLTSSALEEILEYGKTRKSWLLFCSGVKHAHHVRDALIRRGIAAACVTGDTPGEERNRIIQDFKAGTIQALTNCDVLTTGFNAPGVDLLVMLRPTKSTGLYVQIIGRGMRNVWPPGFNSNIATVEERLAAIAASVKPNFLCLDFSGNIAYHGPIDRVDPKRPRGKGGGIAPVKVCPKCDSIIFAGFHTCPDCGYIWPVKPKHAPRAAALSILSDGENATDRPLDGWIRVRDVFYSRAQKDASKPPTLRCTYTVEGGKTVYKWIAVESPNEYAQMRVKIWFTQHGIAEAEIPRTVMEALRMINQFKKPRRILVKPEGQYSTVLGYQF